MLVHGSDLYLGGTFKDAGGNPFADGIVRWDGTRWWSLGRGLGEVKALLFKDGQLYAGGTFSDAGGDPDADLIARWNGTAWRSVGGGFLKPGTAGAVYALAEANGMLYAGGHFRDAANDPRGDFIVGYDGTRWRPLGEGLSGAVYTLASDGPYLYAGGDFLNAGSQDQADHVARWDGSAWQALGAGFNGGAVALAIAGSSVFASGNFTDAGGDPDADRIARWDGQRWTALGTGLNEYARTLAVIGGQLYAGGVFDDAGGIPNADRIARWDGTRWQTVGGGNVVGPEIRVHAIAQFMSSFFVAGDFNPTRQVGDVVARLVSGGPEWTSPIASSGNGLPENVSDLAFIGADLYVAGGFESAGGVPGTNRIARWDGKRWHALANGLPSGVEAFAAASGRLYVSPGFGTYLLNVAWWDGERWGSLGGGLPGQAQISNGSSWVGRLAANSRYVYAAVNSAQPKGGGQTSQIWRFDGTQWTAITPRLFEYVTALVATEDALYIGGSFGSVGAVAAQGLARWDGSQWSSFGFSATWERLGTITALAVSGADLYVGGGFLDAAGNPDADRLARWDGATWYPVGKGLNAAPSAILMTDAGLYVGGSFTDAGGVEQADRVARWDGYAWRPLGAGLDATVTAIAARDGGRDVFVGGLFTGTGDGIGTAHLGHFTNNALAGSAPGAPGDDGTALSLPAPQPATVQTAFLVRLLQPERIRVEAFDLLGRRVATLYEGEVAAEQLLPIRWDTSGLASGLYVIRLDGDLTHVSRKVIVAR